MKEHIVGEVGLMFARAYGMCARGGHHHLCTYARAHADIFALYKRLKDAGVKMHTSEVELRETEGRIFFCEDPEARAQGKTLRIQ